MATYNGARFINDQLSSLAEQSLLPNELVVCDDGSTDDTVKIVEAFAKTAPFPVIVQRNSKRLGFRDNFLKAAGLTKGALIAFCDQDDVWLKTKLEKSCRAIEDNDALMSFHSAIIVDATLRPLGPLHQGIPSNHVFTPLTTDPQPGTVYGFTVVFKRKLLNLVDDSLCPNVPGETEKLYHDVWIAILASVFGNTVHIKEPLALYRQHDGNTLGAKRNSLWTRLKEHMSVPVEIYKRNMAFARQCETALRNSALSLEPDDRAFAMAGAAHYKEKAHSLQRRCEFYGAETPLKRVQIFRSLLNEGVYLAKTSGGLGRLAWIKDIIFLGIAPYRATLPKDT